MCHEGQELNDEKICMSCYLSCSYLILRRLYLGVVIEIMSVGEKIVSQSTTNSWFENSNITNKLPITLLMNMTHGLQANTDIGGKTTRWLNLKIINMVLWFLGVLVDFNLTLSRLPSQPIILKLGWQPIAERSFQRQIENSY